MNRSDYLKECFYYSQDEGRLYWRHRPEGHFKSQAAHRAFNSRYPGNQAGHTHKNKTGYEWREVCLDGRFYREHRVIWEYMTGEEPPRQIDHENRDATDNRWGNMRDGSLANRVNVSIQSNNTSGVKGVDYCKRLNKWRARVCLNRKEYNLGYFRNKCDAEKAVKAMRAELGFSVGHGEIAHYRRGYHDARRGMA